MKIKEKLFSITILLSLLAASCGVRDTPGSISSVEESGDEQASSLQSQEEDSMADVSAEGDGGIVAVADYHYIEMNAVIESEMFPDSYDDSYAINGEWMYMTDYLIDEERTREWQEEGGDSILYNYGITRKRISDGSQEKNYITTDIENWNANRPLLLVDGEGNCYISWRFYDWETKTNTYRLEKYDAEGKLLWAQDPTEEELESIGEQLEQGTVDRKGRVILYSCGEGCAIRFNPDGSLEGVYRPELESLDGVAVGQDDRAYGYCISGGKAVFVELGGTGETYICPMVPNAVYDGYEEGICLDTGMGMFAYEPESEETRLLFGRGDEYVLLDNDKLYKFYQQDGVFTLLCGFTDVLASQNKQIATIARIIFENSRDYPEKQTVTLASDIEFSMTKTLVKMYNRQSRKYKVKVTAQDGKVLTDQLMRGSNADLAEVGRIYTVDLARLGAFEDLTPYYEKSSVVEQGDILESVRDACTVGGKNVTVIPGFVISVMRARGDFVKAEEWNVWKFAEMGQENWMLTSQSPEHALNICMGAEYGEHFIDYENKTCSFDGEEFRRLLELCGKWSVLYSDRGALVEDNTGKGDWLFDRPSLKEVKDFVWRHIDSDEVYNYEGEDYVSTLVGYPGWEGGESRLQAYCAYAISSTSQNKEGAWDFLEYLMSEELQELMEPMLGIFPARKDSFDAYLRNDYVNPGTRGWVVPSEEDIEHIRRMVDTAVLHNVTNAFNPVAVIVSEEAAMYFAGDASLDETVDKIQRRVQLYLDEL